MYVNDVEEFALKTYIRKYLKIIKTLYFDKKAKDQEYAYMRIGAIDVLRGIFVVTRVWNLQSQAIWLFLLGMA